MKSKKEAGSRALDVASSINAAMGKDIIVLGNSKELEVVKIPTPSLTINRITGGGFALGRHVELFGDPGVGKSTILYGTIAMSQARGNLCGVVDPEGVFDQDWFVHQGGDLSRLLYSRPDTAEEIIGALRIMVEKRLAGEPIEIVGIDSVSAMVTTEQAEKDPRLEERMGSQARMMSRALRVLTMKNKKILFIWTNQLRSNIGFGSQFNPHTTSGGRALGFYATTRLEFKKTGAVEEDGKRAEKGELKAKKIKVGDWIQVKAQKEKAAKPYAQGSYIFRTDRGAIDLASEIIQLGLEDEIIEKVGTHYVYETLRGAPIREQAKKFTKRLNDDPSLRAELIAGIEEMSSQIGKVA